MIHISCFHVSVFKRFSFLFKAYLLTLFLGHDNQIVKSSPLSHTHAYTLLEEPLDSKELSFTLCVISEEVVELLTHLQEMSTLLG